MGNVYTPKTLADRWECSERHVRNLIERGALPSFRLGGKLLRIRTTDVETFECQNGESKDCGESLPLPSSAMANGNVAHSELLMRARLNGLRQRSTQS
jgi:excisionase family DNA binding protein